jgi:hypothetical protein
MIEFFNPDFIAGTRPPIVKALNLWKRFELEKLRLGLIVIYLIIKAP